MNGARLVPTPSQTIGPFYHFALTANGNPGCLWRPEAKGERIRIRFRVIDGAGSPVSDGMVEIWQADASGKYNESTFCGFGRLNTDENGVCVFDTIRPGPSENQAPHINVSIFARGLLNHLCTRLYFAGDRGHDADPVLALVPSERRNTLLAQRDPANPTQWNLDIYLQGEHETVFFDV